MTTAIYVRVSTSRQTQTQTIEQQLEQLQHHAQQHGWTVAPDQVFRDDGYSGASLKRPGLDRLRDLAAMAQLSRILITAPDRLARNFVHQTLLLEEFESRGIQVEFLDRPMNQDPHDQLLLQIRGAVAEYERTLIAERMRRGRLQKIQARTLLPWIRAPYGYRCSVEHPRDAQSVSLDAAEAAVVSEIFHRYAQRAVTLDQVSKHLYELGVPSPRGKKAWTVASIRGILTNPVYTGQVYANKTQSCPARQRRSALKPIGRQCSTRMRNRAEWILVAQIPAIIDSELFEAVQVKLQHNRTTAVRNNKVHSYLLRSLVSCGGCQSTCICLAQHGDYRYYKCRSQTIQKRLSEHERCRARYIPAQQLENIVWNDLCDVLKHPKMIDQAMERLQGGHWLPQELKARQTTLQRGQKSLQQQLERLTQAYLGDVLQLEEYRRRRVELETQLQALAVQEQQLTAQAQRHLDLAQLSQGTTEFCQRVSQGLEQATFEQKRQLIELLIDRVVVTQDDVEIRYVIPTSSRGEHSRFCHLRLDYRIHFSGCKAIHGTGGLSGAGCAEVRVSFQRQPHGSQLGEIGGTATAFRFRPVCLLNGKCEASCSQSASSRPIYSQLRPGA